MDQLHIEGFELLEKLGAGGMGAVYKARQLSLDRLVAIKVLPRHAAKHSDYIERFFIEAKIAAALKHNNIVQVYEAGKAGEDSYFVMELVSGYTIASWLERKGALPEEDALLIIEYIGDALRYTWQKAWIIHGDIKPANIMVDSDGTIKLADFLALTPPGGGDRPESLKDNVVGTPNYMSPEQARGVGKLDFHTDIYSLGAVLYHLVTGHLPFQEGSEPRDIMRRQLTDFIPDPTELTPSLSDECAWLIEKMMVKQAANRYHDWDDVILDIHHVKNKEMPIAPLPGDGCSTVSRSSARNRRIIRAPLQESAKHAQEDITHKQASFSFMRTIVYIALIFLVLGSAGAYFTYFHLLEQNEPTNTTAQLLVTHETTTTTKDRVASPPPRDLHRPPDNRHQTIDAPPTDPLIVEEALQSGTQQKLPSPEHAGDLVKYADVFEKVIPLIRYRRKFAMATSLLEHWIQSNPKNYFCDRAMLDQERIGRIEKMFQLIENNQQALMGESVRAKPHISGDFSGISGEVVTLSREGTAGSEAIRSVNLYKISDHDLLKLIKKAAPEDARENTIIWYIADTQYGKAANALKLNDILTDRIFLTAWNDDWSGMIINIRALETLGKIKQEMSRNHYPEAKRLLESAQNRYALSDVFSWAYKTELEQLRERINRHAMPSSPSMKPTPKEAISEPADARYEALREAPATAIVVNNDDQQGEIEQFDIIEVRENMITLDGDIIRLRFRHRGDIRQVDPQNYAVDLGSEYGTIQAVFPSEGFKWIKRVPLWNGRKRRYIYAIVEGKNHRIKLLGRKRRRQPGNQPDEYAW